MTRLEGIVEFMRNSLSDEVLSRQERRELKEMIAQMHCTPEEVGALRSRAFELAAEAAQSQRFPFVLDWLKSTLNALTVAPEPGEVFFSPGEACQAAILRTIDHSTTTLKVCVFTISDDRIARSLLAAHRKGVSVRIITDNDKSLDEGSDIHTLHREGLTVRMDTSPNHMHHKFLVADTHTLITGSYNWTRSAAKFNHENIVVTRDASMVASFTDHFEKLWTEMTPYH
ncbi:MAG: FAM83 family protein [Cyclobacteriaceae bacterium]|nr:FAM83 family protein [Cyclobacteriaceae bacterium]